MSVDVCYVNTMFCNFESSLHDIKLSSILEEGPFFKWEIKKILKIIRGLEEPNVELSPNVQMSLRQATLISTARVAFFRIFVDNRFFHMC